MPEDFIDLDTIVQYYQIKKGKKKIKSIFMADAVNYSFFAYIKKDCLCLADRTVEYAFPLSQMTSIEVKNKKYRMLPWNKEIPVNSPIYKKYKIKTNQYGVIFLKKVVELTMEAFEGTYFIYFPIYEIEALEKLLERKITEENNKVV